jgi:hypothetical protein
MLAIDWAETLRYKGSSLHEQFENNEKFFDFVNRRIGYLILNGIVPHPNYSTNVVNHSTNNYQETKLSSDLCSIEKETPKQS